MDGMDSKPDLNRQAVAQSNLKRDGEPTECSRCGGKPGDPGCGKIIHIVLDAYYDNTDPDSPDIYS